MRKISIHIGQRIRACREALDLTQADVAEKIGKTTITISNIERGKVLVGISTLEALSQVFGVEIAYFFNKNQTSIECEELCKLIKANASRFEKEDFAVIGAVTAAILERRN